MKPVVLATLAALLASPAAAQTGGYYQATPVAGATKARLMTRETPWRLQDGSYVAARNGERQLVLCQLVAEQTGGLSAFSAGGKAYDATQLAACNARVKPALAARGATAGDQGR